MSYYQPTQLADALDILSRAPGKIVAGGTDVYPSSARGQAPDYFLDLKKISEISSISHGVEGTIIGAGATWTDVVRADLPPAFDGLKAAARDVGSIQIQNAATVAGNLCNASPAADGVPPLLALDAVICLQSAGRGPRELPLSAFITGIRKTALAPDELVTAIRVPPQPAQARSAFQKLGSRRYLVISICMTAANIALDDAGRITDVRIAVGACSAVAKRLPALEADLIGKRPQEVRIAPDHLNPLAPISDVRGSAAYRLDVVQDQIAGALQKAAA